MKKYKSTKAVKAFEILTRDITYPMFLAWTALVFIPMESYLLNRYDLRYYGLQILPSVILSALICLVVLQAVKLLFTTTMQKIINGVVLGIALMLHLQDAFLNGELTILDGRTMDFSSIVTNAIIWVIFLTLILIAFFVFHTKYKKHFALSVFFVMAVQIITLTTLSFTTASAKIQNFTLTTEGQFTVSNEKNVVIFMLDTFNKKMFENIITKSPTYKDSLSGFTYFRNVWDTYSSTMVALPYVLTGVYYETPGPLKEYYDYAWQNSTFWKAMNKKEVDVRFFPEYVAGYVSENADFLGNMQKFRPETDVPAEVSSLMNLAKMRMLPYVLKDDGTNTKNNLITPKVTDLEKTFHYQDTVFFQNLKNTGLVAEDYPLSFRFHYLMGSHTPYYLDEDAEFSYIGTSAEQQSRGSLTITLEYIRQLKELKLFDDTMFVIIADHGIQDLSTGPILLVKPFGKSDDPLKVSDAPATQGDVLDTILAQLDGKLDAVLFNEQYLNEKNAVRKSYKFLYEKGWPDKSFMPQTIEYEIAANSDGKIVYTPTGKYFTPTEITEVTNEEAIAVENPPFNLEEYVTHDLSAEKLEISFRRDGNSRNYINSGFLTTESDYTWSGGALATLQIPVDNRTDILMDLDWSYLNKSYPPKIFVNDVLLTDDYYMYDDDEYINQILIPKEVLDTQTQFIEFYTNFNIIPKYEDSSTGKIPLSIKWVSIKLLPTVLNDYGTPNNLLYKSGLPDTGTTIVNPTALDLRLSNGEINDIGEFIAEGANAYVLYGPYKNTKKGRYNITLNYEILSGEGVVGQFDVATQFGVKPISSVEVISSNTSAVISNVTFDNDEDQYEHRVYIKNDVTIKIKNIVIEKLSD